MSILSKYLRRRININPLQEGVTPLNRIVLAVLGPFNFEHLIKKRNITREEGIKCLRHSGYENIVETRDLNAMLDDFPPSVYLVGPWTGFYSRRDEIWVLAFNNRNDANHFWKHHTSLD